MKPGAALFETMRCDPGRGIARLDRHLARLAASAAALGFVHDDAAVRAALEAAVDDAGAHRVRLTMQADGAIVVETFPLPPMAGRATVALAPLPVPPGDPRLRHKTTDRRFYDDARAASGAFEVAFVDPQGRLTEGSFTNLFVARGDRLVTPPLGRGLLPGVLRGALIDTGRAVEGDLRPDDLASGFLIGNALRGLIPAVLRATGE